MTTRINPYAALSDDEFVDALRTALHGSPYAAGLVAEIGARPADVDPPTPVGYDAEILTQYPTLWATRIVGSCSDLEALADEIYNAGATS